MWSQNSDSYCEVWSRWLFLWRYGGDLTSEHINSQNSKAEAQLQCNVIFFGRSKIRWERWQPKVVYLTQCNFCIENSNHTWKTIHTMMEMTVPVSLDPGISHGLGSLGWSPLLWASAQRPKHINLQKQTWIVVNSQRQKKFFWQKNQKPLLSQLQQKFPPSHSFITRDFCRKI